MTQNIELNKIKTKIKALASKTVAAGCTEHEAHEAMAMVGRLLSQYNLSMSEIDVREQVCKTIHINTGRIQRGPIDLCVTALASLVHAKVWSSSWLKDENGNHIVDKNGCWQKETSYSFFGQEDDLELIKYLYSVINSAFKYETALFKKSAQYILSGHRGRGERKSATVSFGYGMSTRIHNRLCDLRKVNDEELRQEQENLDEFYEGGKARGTALMVLKWQLVEGEWKKQGIKLDNACNTRRVKDWGAFSKGHAAGSKVNLSRPITGGSKDTGDLR